MVPAPSTVDDVGSEGGTGVTTHAVLGPAEPDGHLAQLGHFRLGPAEPATGADVLSPGTSLYAFDDDRRRAVFVQCPPEVDLTVEPFLYEAQRRHARRVLLVPYAAFAALFEHAADPDRPALVFSVGRCGSTLLGQALAELATDTAPVVTLSEPDVFTHAVGMRDPDGSRDAELALLLRSAFRSLQRSFGRAPGTRLVIKFRGWSTQVADLVVGAAPGARPLFLTRRFAPWLQSMHRYQRLDDPEREAAFAERAGDLDQRKMGFPLDRFQPILRRTGLPTSRLHQTALTWVTLTEAYRRWHEQGSVPQALDYDTLCDRPVEAVRAVADGFALAADGLAEVPAAFGRDSQAGSRMSGVVLRRTVADLPPERVAEASAMVADLGLDPDLADLPGMLLR